jgi:probable HAF family extracellular repeat protein
LGFLYQDGASKYLQSFSIGGLMIGSPTDINNAEQIVGSYQYYRESNIHYAFIYQNGVHTDLGTLGGLTANATAINDAGQVIGYSQTSNRKVIHGFIYENGVMKDLGTLGGTYINVGGINNAGQVVGSSAFTGDADISAFIYQNGIMTDLNSFVDAADWHITAAYDINDKQQIIGYGCSISTGTCSDVLLQSLEKDSAAVPEPDGLATLLAGCIAFAWVRRRRPIR